MSDLRKITQEHLEVARWHALANKAAELVERYLNGRIFSSEEEKSTTIDSVRFGSDPRSHEAKRAMCQELARLWARTYFSCT